MVAEQLFYAVLTGGVLAVLYDFFRLFRIIFNDKFILDFLFWIISAFSVYSYMLIFCEGKIRSIVFIFIFIGFVLYIMTLGYVTKNIEKRIGKKIKNRLKKLKYKLKSFKKVLHYPRNIYYNITKRKKSILKRNSEGEDDEKGNEQEEIS